MHMAQLMPLPLTVSCFSKIQSGFTFLVLAHLGSPGKRAVKRVCVLYLQISERKFDASYTLAVCGTPTPLLLLLLLLRVFCVTGFRIG